MGRVTRDQMLMGVAQVVARRGTCSRLQVGAVISRDGRIISTGYNGAPSGIPHCEHLNPDTLTGGEYLNYLNHVGKYAKEEPGCQIAEHSERNAIAFAARYGLALEGSEIHCTHAPCLDCARSIINAGIKRVTYVVPYRLTAGVELLAQAGLDVVDMPSLEW